MNKNLLIGVVIVIFLVIAVFQTIQIYNIKNSNLNKQPALSDYDKMMQEHHGTQAVSTQSVSNLPEQVGGC